MWLLTPNASTTTTTTTTTISTYLREGLILGDVEIIPNPLGTKEEAFVRVIEVHPKDGLILFDHIACHPFLDIRAGSKVLIGDVLAGKPTLLLIEK